MQHAIGHIQFGSLGLHDVGQHVNVRPVRFARHGYHAQALRLQTSVQPEPARIIDQNGVARIEKIARHQINRHGHAVGRDHLIGLRVYAQRVQLHHDLLAQRRVATDMTIIVNMRIGAARHSTYRHTHALVFQP